MPSGMRYEQQVLHATQPDDAFLSDLAISGLSCLVLLSEVVMLVQVTLTQAQETSGRVTS